MSSTLSKEKQDEIISAIHAWKKLADDEAISRTNGSAWCPSASITREKIYRNTCKALGIELRTGVAVCSCCFKPYGRGTAILPPVKA